MLSIFFKFQMSESIASSLGSNLNKVTSGMPIIGGPSDLKKMLLGDDYFSDVNPRSMRRLMNIIHITGNWFWEYHKVIDFPKPKEVDKYQ